MRIHYRIVETGETHSPSATSAAHVVARGGGKAHPRQRWCLIDVLGVIRPSQFDTVPSLIPISRATCAIGRDDASTVFTASSRNSGLNFL